MPTECPDCGEQYIDPPVLCLNCGARLRGDGSKDASRRKGKHTQSPDTVLVPDRPSFSETVNITSESGVKLPAGFGRHRVLRFLGRGAMGIVYLARDDKISRNVAIKVLEIDSHLPSSEQKEIRDRFEREARAAGILSHPNIVTVYDVGEQDGTPYIAMEYLEGANLAEITTEGPLPIEQATAVITQVLSALAYAHGHDVVHRDIKPDNIFLLPDGRVKVADFGIARMVSSSTMTQVGQVMGTPGYMSPEQVKGEVVGPPSDIFSTGVLFYELLTGTAPFTSSSATSIMYKIVHEQPKPLRILNPGVPSQLEAVIAKATAKSPSLRYAGASEMKQDIETGQVPSVATPLSPNGTVVLPQGVTEHATVLRAEPFVAQAPLQQGAYAQPYAAIPAETHKKKKGLWIGIGAGALAVIIVAVVVVVVLMTSGKVSLTIEEPSSGQSVSASTMHIKVKVSDPGAVDKVEVYVDNQKKGTLDSPSFKGDVEAGAGGPHDLRVSAYKGESQVGDSKTVSYEMKAGPDTGATDDRAAIGSLIENWRGSWQSHNINSYLALYSQSFNSGPVNVDTFKNKSFAEWAGMKTNQFQTQSPASVTVENLNINVRGDEAATAFYSTYTGGDYHDAGTYRIEFKKEQGSWKIISEQWRNATEGTAPPGPFLTQIP